MASIGKEREEMASAFAIRLRRDSAHDFLAWRSEQSLGMTVFWLTLHVPASTSKKNLGQAKGSK
jgi:hypothetical protein